MSNLLLNLLGCSDYGLVSVENNKSDSNSDNPSASSDGTPIAMDSVSPDSFISECLLMSSLCPVDEVTGDLAVPCNPALDTEADHFVTNLQGFLRKEDIGISEIYRGEIPMTIDAYVEKEKYSSDTESLTRAEVMIMIGDKRNEFYADESYEDVTSPISDFTPASRFPHIYCGAEYYTFEAGPRDINFTLTSSLYDANPEFGRDWYAYTSLDYSNEQSLAGASISAYNDGSVRNNVRVETTGWDGEESFEEYDGYDIDYTSYEGNAMSQGIAELLISLAGEQGNDEEFSKRFALYYDGLGNWYNFTQNQ